MSDFGTDVGNSGMSLMGKIIDALVKLIGKIYDTMQKHMSAEYKLRKAEYAQMKDRAYEKKFAEKVEGKTGFVAKKDLERAGVPLTVTGITIDDSGMKELAERCKREGIVITGVEDIRERELKGNKTFIVECKQSDLPKLASLVDLMNDERKINLINNAIDEQQKKNTELEKEVAEIKGSVNAGEELTEEQKKRLDEIGDEINENNGVIDSLNEQIYAIRYGHQQGLNNEQAQGIVEKAINGATNRGVGFDEAVNRWTGGSIDKNTTCYIVDAKDPNKYVIAKASNDTYNNSNYIKTDYEVYNGSKQVYATNDKRFDGRPKDYWVQEKANMREKGGIGDLVIKFYSLKEVEAYRENYKLQNETELNDLGVGKEGRDYDDIIKKLETKIDENGGVYKDGIVVDKETQKPMLLTNDMATEEKANIAEATIVGKQIDNYKEIKQLETELAIARSNVITSEEGTQEFTQAKSELDKLENKYSNALGNEVSLIEERKNINAVQAEQSVQQAEKSDDRREERVTEIDDDRKSLVEYKGEIENERKNDGAKGNDVRDRNTTKSKAIPKEKTDR